LLAGCARGGGVASRYAASLFDFGRLNHRMHNKLFIADGAMAVIGGRNVANEYYLRGASENFVDVDAFTAGWLIAPLQFQFDRYWNSAAVYPLKAIAKTGLSDAELLDVRAGFLGRSAARTRGALFLPTFRREPFLISRPIWSSLYPERVAASAIVSISVPTPFTTGSKSTRISSISFAPSTCASRRRNSAARALSRSSISGPLTQPPRR